MYYLIRRKTGGGASEALDTEYDVAKLTLGDGLDAVVHMVGLRDVLELEASGDGFADAAIGAGDQGGGVQGACHGWDLGARGARGKWAADWSLEKWMKAACSARFAA